MAPFKLSSLAVTVIFGLSACSSSNQNEENIPNSTSGTSVGQTVISQPSAPVNTSNETSNTTSGQTTTSQPTVQTPINTSTNSSTPTAQPVISQPSTQNPVNTPVIPNASTSKINGIAYTFQSHNAANQIEKPELLTLASDDKNILHVGDNKIELAPNGLMPGYTLIRSDENIIMSLGSFVDGTDYMPNTQFGIFSDKANNRTYVFTQGSLTEEKDMPKEGEVRYLGLSAYHLTNDSLTGSSWPIYGVDLHANFTEKTLKGALTMSDAPDIKIDTKISGNSFNSEPNSDTQVKGYFYGEKAKELGGVYVNEKEGYSGAFSAKQW